MNFGSPAVTPRRGILIVLGAVALLAAALAILAFTRRSPHSTVQPRFGDGTWELTFFGEFDDRRVDFEGSRLRLRAGTRRGSSEAVRFLGVRKLKPIRLTPGARVAVDLDWNRQANGSGLTAGIVLSPTPTSLSNPFALPQCLWVEFIGVPPGKNARRVVGVREQGHHRHLDDEGWPEINRAGRPIGVQRLEIRIDTDGRFRVLENGAEVCVAPPGALKFDSAYLYLQMSSRPNYPPREVFFDNIVVEPGK